jgi:hypothetical protein
LTGIERDVREVRLTGIERAVAGGSLSLWLQRRRRLPTPAQGCCNPGYTEQVNINAESVGQRFQRCSERLTPRSGQPWVHRTDEYQRFQRC